MMTSPMTEAAGGEHNVRPEYVGALTRQLQSIKAACSSLAFLTVVMKAFLEALSLSGKERQSGDELVIQYTLLLVKNLLLVPNPKRGQTDSIMGSNLPPKELHELFLVALDDAGLMEALATLAALCQQMENAEHTMFLLDTIAALVGGVDAAVLVAAAQQEVASARSEQGGLGRGTDSTPDSSAAKSAGAQDTMTPVGPKATNRTPPSAASDPLAVALKAERASRGKLSTARHSRFAGAYAKDYGSAGRAVVNNVQGLAVKRQPARKAQRRKRFSQSAASELGSASGELTSRSASLLAPSGLSMLDTSGVTHEARMVLYNWGCALLDSAYSVFVGCVLRRLNLTSITAERDRRNYMALACFALNLQRSNETARVRGVAAEAARSKRAVSPEEHFTMGETHVSMEFTTIKLVTAELDEAMGMKNYDLLSGAVELMSEYMSMAAPLLTSKHPKAKLVAESVRRGALSESDVLDVIPNMLAKYEPGRFNVRFLTTLVSAAHAVVKAVMSLEAAGARVRKGGGRRRKSAKSRPRKSGADEDLQYDDDESDEEKAEEEAMRRPREADIKVDDFLIKFASPHTVEAYLTLLAQYRGNSAETNKHIALFLHRLSELPNPRAGPSPSELAHSAWKRGGQVGDEPPKPTPFTFEPMLWNVTYLRTYNTLLHDPVAHVSPTSADLLRVVRRLVRHFTRAAMEKPLLFAEMLVRRNRDANARMARLYKPAEGEERSERGPTKRAAMEAAVQRETLIAKELASDDEDEAEFDLDVAADLDSGKVDEALVAQMAAKRQAAAELRRRSKGGDSDGSDSSGSDGEGARRKRKGGKGGKSSAGGARGRRWSVQEDGILRDMYPKYADMASCWELLAAVPELEEAGRTPQQIARRAKAMKLHLELGERGGSGAARVHGRSGATYQQAQSVVERLGGKVLAHTDAVSEAQVLHLPKDVAQSAGLSGAVNVTALRGVGVDGQGVRAVAWVRQQLHAVICSRAVPSAGGEGALPIRGQFAGAYLGESRTWNTEGSGDYACLPLLSAEFAWAGKPIVTALLRECGAKPPAGTACIWWRFPASLSTEQLLLAADGIDRVLLRLPAPAVEEAAPPQVATGNESDGSSAGIASPAGSASSPAAAASPVVSAKARSGAGKPRPAKKRRMLRAAAVDSDSSEDDEAAAPAAAGASTAPRVVASDDEDSDVGHTAGATATAAASDSESDIEATQVQTAPVVGNAHLRVALDDDSDEEDEEGDTQLQGTQVEQDTQATQVTASQGASQVPGSQLQRGGTIFADSDSD